MTEIEQPRRLHLLLTASVALWYAGSTYLPEAAGSCLSTSCDPTPARLALSVLIPVSMAVVPIGIEVWVFGSSVSRALRELGITRWHTGGLGLALVYLLPLWLFFPAFAACTGQALSVHPSWLGRSASAVLNNGLNEEIMLRGFVFRRLQQLCPFWRAAALSTAYFTACHLPLIATAGPLIGSISVLIAIPTGLLFALLHERGQRTIWANALAHTGTNLAPFLFAVGPASQPIASSLYLLTSILVASSILVTAGRRQQLSAPLLHRQMGSTGTQPPLR